MAFPVEAVRAQIPALAEGAAHFDGPGGSLVPTVVADAVRDVLASAINQRGSITLAEKRSDRIVLEARQAMADLLGVDPSGIVFGKSKTALTFDFSRTLATQWHAGDEIVLSRLDHDANIRPWLYVAESCGLTVRWLDFDPGTSEVAVDSLESLLTDRTRLVAVTAASNLIGTRPPLAAIAKLTHDAGALLYVDGVHNTAHSFVDVAELGADFYGCSPYKFCGTHCGVLAASPELLETLSPGKLLPSPDTVPERFELGTPPFELLAGTTAAVDFLANMTGSTAPSRRERLRESLTAMEAHEDALRQNIETGLAELPGVTIYSRAQRRTPTLLFSIEGMAPRDISAALGELGVNAPAGSFYAVLAAERLGLGLPGGVRVGLAPYSSQTDVDRLLAALAKVLRA